MGPVGTQSAAFQSSETRVRAGHIPDSIYVGDVGVRRDVYLIAGAAVRAICWTQDDGRIAMFRRARALDGPQPYDLGCEVLLGRKIRV